jgi:diguanylate cyclase (GGDEF)-like protein/PAS domain S-box-containing protein
MSERSGSAAPPPAPWWSGGALLQWIIAHAGRNRGFQCGLVAAAMLFVLSLGISLTRITEQYQLEARIQRSGLWMAAQANVELSRMMAVLQRYIAGDLRADAVVLDLQFEIVLSRITLLDSGDGATEYGAEMQLLRARLPEVHALLAPVDTWLQQLIAGEAGVAEDITVALDQVEALLRQGALQLHLERQVAAQDAVGGLRNLHWTLLGCVLGLIGSVGLLLLLLRLESLRARRLLVGAEAAERRQRQAERTLRVLIDSLPTMVSAYDRQGRYLFFNNAYARFHGLEEDGSAIGRSPQALGIPLDTALEQALAGQASQPFAEFAAADAAGSLRTVLAIAVPVDDEYGGAGQIVHVALDISDRKAAEDRVRHLAEHDALTDLPNRMLFATRLRHALTQARRQEERGGPRPALALHCIDLDRFKEVNDSLGHQAGDSLLLAAAERMRACLRRGDTLARLGGDEFAILQADVGGEEEASRLASRLVRVLGLPFVIDGCTVHTGASIGSVMAPLHGRSAEELQQRGDIALYRAKAEGRARGVLFSPEMAAAQAERRELEADLRTVLASGEELFLVYQPKFDLGQVIPTGCEALLRWRHPKRGMISPATFVPITEEAGLAADLSRLVLRLACAQIRAWMSEGLEIPVAVNLSAQHFASDQAVLLVEEALAAAGVPPRLLEIEVTEGVFIRNAAAARGTLAALRALGVRVALDDFGTGYSSLSYLQHLPFDVVKVDRAFVRDLKPGYGSGVRVVDAIVRLAHGLGARVVAEGVELPEQLEVLRRLGCDSVQGFLLGRPMPPEELEMLFDHGEPAAGKVA